MRVVLITQDDPFFLGASLDRLLRRFPAGASVVGCVLMSPSPFGKRETTLGKFIRTYQIFGARFLCHYLLRFAKNRFRRDLSVPQVLERHGVPVVRLADAINSEPSLATIRNLRPDLMVSVAGNQVFRRPLIDIAPHGCLNLHGALLPKYRGLLPSFWVLKNRERYSGVSVFLVENGIDSGPILVQKRFDIGGMTQEHLIEHSKSVGMDAIVEAVEMIMRGDTTRIANSDADATYHSFPTARDVAEFRRAGARFF